MTKPPIHIRPAEIKDAVQLAAIAEIIIKEGYGLATPEEADCSVKRYKKGVKEAMKNPHNQFFICALIQEEVVGSLFFKRSHPQKYRHHGSFGMSLNPSFRNLGIGSLLLEHLLQWAENQSDLHKVTLEVLAQNERAIHLYHKHGFYEEGRLKKHVYFRRSYEDLVLMARSV